MCVGFGSGKRLSRLVATLNATAVRGHLKDICMRDSMPKFVEM